MNNIEAKEMMYRGVVGTYSNASDGFSGSSYKPTKTRLEFSVLIREVIIR